MICTGACASARAAASPPNPAPTIDITIHFRSALGPRPAGELVLARSRTRLVHEGFFEEDAEVWAADGTLLAHSRQLALLID